MVLFKRGVLLMKNKMICTLLTTVMVLSFAACGSQGNGAAASTESTVASESQVTESNAEANTETASTESTAVLIPFRAQEIKIGRAHV